VKLYVDIVVGPCYLHTRHENLFCKIHISCRYNWKDQIWAL